MSATQETELVAYDFIGLDRHNLPGVHPHERIREGEEFPVVSTLIRDEDGLVRETVTTAEAWAEHYRLVRERAKALLAVWPDQSAIRIHERETMRTDDMVVEREAG